MIRRFYQFVVEIKGSLGLDLFIILLFSLFTCRALFLSEGKFVAGSDLLTQHFWMEPYFWNSFRGWIYTWNPFPGCGFATNPPTPLFLLNGILAIMASVIHNGLATVVTKLFVFVIFLLSGLSMYLLVYRLLKTRTGAFVSALFYMYNQWFLSEHLSEGHFGGPPLAYAIAPLIFLTLENALESPRKKNVLVLSIVLTLFFSNTTHQPIYLYGAFTLLYLFFWVFMTSKDKKKRITVAVKVSIQSLLICFMLSAYWILPEILFVRNYSVLFGVYHAIDDAYGLSYKTPFDAIAIRNSVDNLRGQRIPYWEFPPLQSTYVHGLMFFIPILAFAAIFIHRNRLTIFYTISAVVSSFLALGPNGMPFRFFSWLWNNIPGYSTFRVGGRFLMMTPFSYCFLIGVTVGWCYKKLSFRDKASSSQNLIHRYFRFFILKNVNKAFIILVLLNIICYSWIGSVDGFQVYNWPSEYTEPYEWIRDQREDFRVQTLPSGRLYVNYSWSYGTTTDLGLSSYGIDNKGVFATGRSYSGDYAGFIHHMIRSNSTDMLSPLLGIAGVRYVVLQPDASLHEQSFFDRQRNFVATPFGGSATIVENTLWSPHIFPTQKAALIVGGRETMVYLEQIEPFDLNEWALHFSDQLLSKELANDYDAIIFSDTDILDFVYSSLGKNYTVEAAKFGFPRLNSTKYWIPSTQHIGQGELVLGRSTLSTGGKVTIDVPIRVPTTEQYEIWLRVLYGPDRGRMSVKLDGQTMLSDYQPFAVVGDFNWIRLPKVYLSAGEYVMTLINDGSGYNDVDVMVAIGLSKLQTLQNEVVNVIENSNARLIYALEAEKMFLNKGSSGWYPSGIGHYMGNGFSITSDIASESETQIFMPRAGSYKFAVLLVKGRDYGDLLIEIDNAQRLKIGSNDTAAAFFWSEVGPIELEAGSHSIKILNDGSGRAEVDKFLIYSVNDGEGDISLRDVFDTSQTDSWTCKQVSPVEYVAHVKLEKASWLIFGESYHPLWRAYVGNREIESTVAYSFMNSFFIDETGELDIRIYFTGQNYLHVGGIISIMTVATIAVYLAYTRVRKVYHGS